MNQSRLATRIRWRDAKAAAPASLAMVSTATAEAVSPFELDPPLSPLDEAVFLLHTIAEVEHSLMVQYLYAAYSLKDEFADCQVKLRATAQEEMGHLITVQNLLLSLGGPLNFDREDFPFRSGLYPFPYSLEPVTLGSIAKYVMAEKPLTVDAAVLPPELEKEIREKSKMDAGMEVDRVGMVLARLVEVLDKLPAGVFRPDSNQLQADPGEWSGWASVDRDSSGNVIAVSSGVLVMMVTSKKEALDAITAIMLQGEGAAAEAAGTPESHFRRFLELYKTLRDMEGPYSFPVPEDPSASASSGTSAITFPPSRYLAQLANLRYRFLLASIPHSLGIARGDAARGTLIGWSFAEMTSHIGPMARLLVTMPRQAAGGKTLAAAPFDLPYSLVLAVREPDRWRMLGEILTESAGRIEAIRTDPEFVKLPEETRTRLTAILNSVEQEDKTRQAMIVANS